VLWERSVTEQRYNAVLEVLEAGLPVTEVADRYGVSRQSVHTWIARYRAGGLEGLADRSHRPNRCPHQLAAAVEARVCELRRQHPGWGPQRLRHELERRGVEPLPSRMAIYRVLVRNRLITPDRRRRQRTWRRFQRERPMELWQLDLVELPLADGTEIKVLTGVDDHSRYCVSAQAMVRATGRAVCRGLVAALGRYGVPEEVLTDIHAEWRADRACGSGRPRRFISNRRSSVTAAIAIGAAWVDSLPVDRGGGRGPRRRGGAALLGT
jgi:transposase